MLGNLKIKSTKMELNFKLIFSENKLKLDRTKFKIKRISLPGVCLFLRKEKYFAIKIRNFSFFSHQFYGVEFKTKQKETKCFLK